MGREYCLLLSISHIHPSVQTLNENRIYIYVFNIRALQGEVPLCYCIAVCKNGNQDIIKVLTFSLFCSLSHSSHSARAAFQSVCSPSANSCCSEF